MTDAAFRESREEVLGHVQTAAPPNAGPLVVRHVLKPESVQYSVDTHVFFTVTEEFWESTRAERIPASAGGVSEVGRFAEIGNLGDRAVTCTADGRTLARFHADPELVYVEHEYHTWLAVSPEGAVSSHGQLPPGTNLPRSPGRGPGRGRDPVRRECNSSEYREELCLFLDTLGTDGLAARLAGSTI